MNVLGIWHDMDAAELLDWALAIVDRRCRIPSLICSAHRVVQPQVGASDDVHE
jgi:hypothetical protein